MSQRPLPYRQIHLDFHTSPDIPAIGAEFDPEVFADTLAKAHVNSITCFARCHHGLIYYPSQRNPERVHPQLARKNLLLEQIEACHQRGIRVPIYTTVQWDDYTADAQRDWLIVDADGVQGGQAPFKAGFYRYLDVFHPGYRAFLKRHVQEILDLMPVDGFFFDIVKPMPSLAKHWLDAMDDAGLDPEDEAARQQFAVQVIDAFKLELSEFVHARNPDCTIFYNAGHVGPRHRATQPAYTHYELESLPSGGWGYLHFPSSMRYARGLGKPSIGMTGKFHTSWGDFHSYKNEVALEFECFHMLALGAGCSIGDQLHPAGALDTPSYDLIGRVYQQVEAKEPWCRDAEAVSEAAILTPEAFGSAEHKENQADRTPASVLGAVRMLQELQLQFDIVDETADFGAYKLLILPDEVPCDTALKEKLEHYLDAGGALIASYRAGLTPDGQRFASEHFGVTLVGEAPYSPDFLVPSEPIAEGLPLSPHVMYLPGLEVTPQEASEVLAEVEIPYFNRSWRHYCSHRHTPSKGERAYPGIVKRERLIYFAHPMFRQYHESAPRWCKQLVANALGLLLPTRLVEVEGPSSLLVTLNHQPEHKRYVLHLLHYLPERRGQAFDTIEDVIPLYDIKLKLALNTKLETIKLVPEGQSLDFEYTESRVRCNVPSVYGHQMLELRYR